MLRVLACLLLMGLTLDAGTALAGPSREPVDELTRQLLTLNAQSQQGDTATRAGALAGLVRVAAARREQLAALIADHPEMVLGQALSAQARAALPAAVQGYIEKEEDAEGELEVLYVDGGEAGSRALHFLKRGADRMALHFAGDPPSELQSGDRVRVSGIRVKQAMALSSGQQQLSVLSLAVPNTFGAQQTAVLLVTFADKTTPLVSPAQARSVTFDPTVPTSVTNFFKDASYGQAWLVGDVYGPYLIPMASTAACDPSGIASSARIAAQNAGVDLAPYHRLVFAFPSNTCASQFWGLSTVGGNPSQSWITSSYHPGVVAHELGHAFGLWHSHSLDCGSVTITSGRTGCTASEYGDTFDAMGNATASNHFNAVQKERLGWLNYGSSPPVTTVQASGVYTLDPYEPVGSNPKALKVLTPSGDYYYVEYRQPIDFDASTVSNSTNVKNGVVVHLWVQQSSNGIYLLDMTPNTSSWMDPAVDVSYSFTDAAAGITISPVWVTSAGAGVNVTVGSGGSCVRKNPTVKVSPAEQQGMPGTTVSYTVSVTNNDSGCSSSNFTQQASAPSGWTAAFASTTLNIAPGATASTTLQVKSPTSTAAGRYTILPTASNNSAPSASGSTTAMYDVPNTAGGTFTDNFDRPDSSALGNGWTQVAGSLLVNGGQARNAAVRTMHTAAQLGLVGATQSVAASFASVDNNLGPRFGLLARFKDAKNYYTCYRQTGGTSVLRISRVVNGVETVLKSASISNPQREAFFTLGCQAQGTTLTLSYNGATKLSVPDPTFSTGSVGMSMGYPTSGTGSVSSHRADNFTATAQ